MADDVASLGIEVDSSQVEAGSEALQKYAAEARRTGETVAEVQARMQASTKAISDNSQAAQISEGVLRALAARARESNLSFEELKRRYVEATQAQQQNSTAADAVFASHAKVTATGRTQAQMWRALAHEVALVNPQLAEVARSMAFITGGMGHVGVAATAVVVGIAALTAAATAAVVAFAKFETSQVQLTAALQLIQGRSGQTAQSIDLLARSLAQTGTVTRETAEDAAKTLIQFRNLGEAGFAPAAEAARKLAGTGLVTMSQAADALGKALDKPRNATEELAKAFITLDPAQQRIVDNLLRSGQFFEAQAVVLANITNTTKQLADSADTLAAAWRRFIGVGDTLLIQMGEWLDKTVGIRDAINSVTEALDQFSRSNETRQRTGFVTQGVPAAQEGQPAQITVRPEAQVTGRPEMDVQEFAKFKKAIEERADALRIQAEAEGMAAGAAATHTEKQRLLLQAERDGVELSPEMKRQLDEQAGAVGALTAAIVENRIQFQLRLQTMAATGKITDEEARIVQTLIPLYGQDIPAALGSAEAAQIKFNNTLRTAANLTGEFINTFVDGLAKGEGAAKSLQSAMQGLGSSITRAASQQLGKQLVGSIGSSALGTSLGGGLSSIFGTGAGAFGGPLAGLAVGAGITAIGGLFDNTKKQQEQQAQQAEFQRQQQELQAAGLRAEQLLIRVQKAALDTTTQAGALAAFDIDAQQQRNEEIRAGGQAIVQLEAALAQERLAIIQKFDDQAAAAEKQRFADAAKNIEQIQRGINEATGKGFLNQFADLIQQVQKARQDALLLGGAAPSLVETFFGVSAQKIIEDTGLVGDAFRSVLEAFPELSGVIHESTTALKQAADQQAQLIQQQINELNRAAQGIVDYVNNLLAGPSSTLSPQARFAQAQSTFNAVLALAQAGNLDALNRITQDAENLRLAARDLFGSSSNFQTVFNQITSQLLALPAVTGSTDPVVLAIQDAITAIHGTTGAVSAQDAQLNAIQAQTFATQLLSAAANQLMTSISQFTQATQQSVDQLVQINVQTGGVLQLLNNQASFLSAIANNTATTASNTNTLAATVIGIGASAQSVFVIGGTIGTHAGARGGLVTTSGIYAASGGFIGGGIPGRDSVPAMLMPGEMVIRESVARKNPWLLDFNRTGVAGANDNISNGLDRIVRMLAALGERLGEPLDDMRDVTYDMARRNKGAA